VGFPRKCLKEFQGEDKKEKPESGRKGGHVLKGGVRARDERQKC